MGCERSRVEQVRVITCEHVLVGDDVDLEIKEFGVGREKC